MLTARMKCNRCGENKSPKRNVKGKVKNSSDNKSVDSSDDINSSSEKKRKKEFAERIGDWVCIKCKNLNFSFRLVCNRCQLPKTDSEKLLENYMSNLSNYFKLNEMMQQQMFINNNPNHPNVNTNSININNNYFNHPNNGGRNVPSYIKNNGYGNQGGINVSNYMGQNSNTRNIESNVSNFDGNNSGRKEYYQQDGNNQ